MTDIKQQGAFVAAGFEAMKEFTAAGHREIAPVYMKDAATGLMAVHGTHGLYRMGIHADGRPVVLFAADPENLAPVRHKSDKFREKFAPGHYIDLQRMGQVDVIAARRQRTHKKWVARAVTEHGYYQNDIKAEYGFLYRTGQNEWMSGAVAYTLDPATRSGRKAFAPDGTPLMLLRCYTTPGKGDPFSQAEEQAIRARRASVIPCRTAWVRPEEAEAIIRDDFIKRANLVMRDMDPNKLGGIRGEPAMASMLAPFRRDLKDKAGHLARHYTVRVNQQAQNQLRNLKAQVVVMGVFKTAVLSAVQLVSRGWRAFFGQVVMGVLQPVMESIKRAKAMNEGVNDIGFTFWQPGRSGVTGRKHYCSLDPAQGRFIRLLQYAETDIKPARGAQETDRLPQDWAEDYLLGTLDAPTGTVAEKRRIGEMDVLYSLEPGGLELYYLLGRKIVYAVHRPDLAHAQSEKLPGPVQRLLAEKGPVVKVREGGNGALQSEPVAPALLAADMTRETALPEPLAYVPPLMHDLSPLRAFNERANDNAAPVRHAIVQKALSVTFNVTARVRKAIGLRAAEQDNQPNLLARTLDHHLSDREPSEQPQRHTPL